VRRSASVITARARRLDRREAGVAGARADRQRDARQMQHARCRDTLARQVGRAHAAGRRTRAEEVEVVAARVVRDEVDRRERVGVAAHRRMVDAFAAPQRAQHRAVGVVAERADVGDARALARRGDGEVARVPAVALQVDAAVALARLVELDHRLAERDDVDERRGRRRAVVVVRYAHTWPAHCAATSRR